jgi:hypothetical protein
MLWCLGRSGQIQRRRLNGFEHFPHGNLGRIWCEGGQRKGTAAAAEQQGGNQGSDTLGVLIEGLADKAEKSVASGDKAVAQMKSSKCRLNSARETRFRRGCCPKPLKIQRKVEVAV